MKLYRLSDIRLYRLASDVQLWLLATEMFVPKHHMFPIMHYDTDNYHKETILLYKDRGKRGR
jgi:hypothetical protein